MKSNFSVLIMIVISSCLFLPLLRASDHGINQDPIVKKFSYETLSFYQKKLFDEFLTEEIPAGASIASILTDHTSIRTKTRLAEALLFRNHEGDKGQAAIILQWILANQNQDEQSKYYGIWKTSISNDLLDQNWREFIGCDLIIISHHYRSLLPAEIIGSIEKGLIHAAKGALIRNVSAGYTNISIMSAFLMEYVGTEFKIDELKNAGLTKARDIYTLYQKHHTWSEYNSPTYYGVALIGLALWREFSFSSEMHDMGLYLEKEFWHEITTFYNPRLKNMAGPYFRGYGMDMKKYFAIVGIWIALALDDERSAPLPSGDGPKYGEMSNLATIFHLGISIPREDMTKLTTFTKSKYITRIIPNEYKGDSLKIVTATIHEDWMMGGLQGNRRIWNQIKAGTIHWLSEEGDIAWLLVPGDGKTNVVVDKNKMTILKADQNLTSFELCIYAKHIHPDRFSRGIWSLPGMQLKIKTGLPLPRVVEVPTQMLQSEYALSEQLPYLIKLVFEVPPIWKSDKAMLQIRPKKTKL